MTPARTATHADIPELVRLRALLFDTLSGRWGPAPREDWRDACAVALGELLAMDTARVLVIDGEAGLAACGMGVLDRRLPSPYNPSGLIGHVFGVVTDPGYRGRGHARAIMTELLRWFDERGVRRVDLNASPDGEPLYRGLGFTDHPYPVLSLRP